MSDTAFAELRSELYLLAERVGRLERLAQGDADPADLERLIRAVTEAEVTDDDLAMGLPLSVARRMFPSVAVDAALASKRLFRRRDPLAGVTVLRTTPATPNVVDIEAYLRQSRPGQDAPRAFASFATLREVFNKNTVTSSVERLRRQGRVVVGTMATGHPGRPPRAVMLAEVEHRPTHVDGLPVKWET